jgi:hypothetical protein
VRGFMIGCVTPRIRATRGDFVVCELETNPCDGMELARRTHLPPTMDKFIEVPSATMTPHVRIYISGTEEQTR